MGDRMSTPIGDVGTTVAIPARNASGTIGRCLDAVWALDHRPVRVLVLDDGSSDMTATIARSRGAEVVAVPNGGGLGRARNLGLSECRTPFLAFLNADCYPRFDWLSTLGAVLLSTGAAAVGGRQVELRLGTWAERWKALHLRPDLGDQRVIGPDYLSGGNLLLEMSQAREVPFGDQYRTAYEDVAFCRSLRETGRLLVYDPAAIVEHDHRETMRTLPRKVWSYGVHSRAVGPVQSVWQAPRAFVRMHRRPNDHLRLALPDDVRQGRIGYVLIDTYLLCASLAFFIGYARRSRACALPNPDTEPSMAKG
jgi:glycosyltransferase involved in cell wall biosynthesis